VHRRRSFNDCESAGTVETVPVCIAPSKVEPFFVQANVKVAASPSASVEPEAVQVRSSVVSGPAEDSATVGRVGAVFPMMTVLLATATPLAAPSDGVTSNGSCSS
jgi:hypothetical protein